MNCLPNKDNKQDAGYKPAFWADLLLFVNLCVVLCLVGWVAVDLQYPEGDVSEHLHASFRVYIGDIPYRDFFEHHHLLLWFLTAPLLGFMEKNSAVLGVMDYLTFLFFVVGLGYIYKIVTTFLFDRTVALASVILLLVPGVPA